jgi:hypothetical protein
MQLGIGTPNDGGKQIDELFWSLKSNYQVYRYSKKGAHQGVGSYGGFAAA